MSEPTLMELLEALVADDTMPLSYAERDQFRAAAARLRAEMERLDASPMASEAEDALKRINGGPVG